jgi:hypothetical protein
MLIGRQSSWVNHACTLMHHWMPFQSLSSRPHAKDKHGWAESMTLQEIHGGMWSKWSKGAWTWLKARASSARTNNASKGVDESVWVVQQVEQAGTKVTKGRWSCWKKTEPGRGTQPPGLVGLGRPVPVFCRQVALSFLHLCAQVFESRTTIDIAILLKLDFSNNSHL